MTRIMRLWRGELPLANAFWDWAVIGGIIVNVGSTIIFFILLMHDYLVAAFVTSYVLPVPYNILAGVGVWRSAGRYEGDRRWADLARVVAVVGLGLLTLI